MKFYRVNCERSHIQCYLYTYMLRKRKKKKQTYIFAILAHCNVHSQNLDWTNFGWLLHKTIAKIFHKSIDRKILCECPHTINAECRGVICTLLYEGVTYPLKLNEETKTKYKHKLISIFERSYVILFWELSLCVSCSKFSKLFHIFICSLCNSANIQTMWIEPNK